MQLKIKRVYEPFDKSDGFRILVDRVWPRGLSKEKLHYNIWLKEIAPSAELRKWFDHDPLKWKQFLHKYFAEIKNSDAMKELQKLLKENKIVTLIYGAKNEENNQAVALKTFLGNAHYKQ